jgi:C4-dicarboxylate-specific signal transduction histidine kinase
MQLNTPAAFSFLGVLLLSFLFFFSIFQPKVDHLFQRRRYNLEETLSRFIDDVIHLKGITQLVQRIEEIISKTLYSQRIDIFMFNETMRQQTLANIKDNQGEIASLNIDKDFLQWLTRNDRIIYREYIDTDPAYSSIKDKVRKYCDLTEAMVVVPLVLNERLLGVINLGKKANLRRYTSGDFHFLASLRNQTVIAISNSLLYENIEEQVRQRTKELVEVQKQLTQAEKLATVGTLAGGVAHEINNPLTAILTNIQMLLNSDTIRDASDRESLSLVEEATKRCRTIVKKLMVYARKPLESTELSKVNLLDIVKNTISFIGYQLEQDNITIIIDSKEEEYLVLGKYNELEQLVTNLILNAKDAIKRIKKSGKIYMSLLKSNKWIKLIVKDEGIGMSKDEQSKIFDPFFTTKEVGAGLGLGLSICQAIVRRCGGVITVQSKHNNGATFTVQFPSLEKKDNIENKMSL